MIPIRNKKEINYLEKSNNLVAKALDLARNMLKPGLNVLELDKSIEDFIRRSDATPAFKGLYGFPNASCISINEVIIHGIPKDYILQDGDIIGIDVGVQKDGWYGDGAFTATVGEAKKEDLILIDCAKTSLLKVIDEIKVGMYFKEISQIIEDSIKGFGFVPLQDFCGHGIGRKPHDDPQIFNYVRGNAKQGPKVREGMVFCLEPMVCQKDGRPVILDDGWSVISKDNMNTSHYEHTVAMIGSRAQILTKI